MTHKSYRIINGKAKWAIVDEQGKIINNEPNKEELKGLKAEPRQPYDTRKKYRKYKKEELLDELIRFEKENGRSPRKKDLENNPEYPSRKTYDRYFRGLENAKRLVGLDTDTMIRQGVSLDNNYYKGRQAELIILEHFKKNPVDLAGGDYLSSCDGICPNGKIYDVKSSKLYVGGSFHFTTRNKYKEEIEIYYFMAFNEDYMKLIYAWRVPGEIVESDDLHVGLNSRSSMKFTLENMKEYDITDKLKDVLSKYGFLK